jgi:uncharacterized phage protein gp47/JayE
MTADFSEYIDLTIYDQEPGDIYLNSIEMARLTLPEFELRPGTPEDAIFQAAAYISWLNAVAINRLPDRLMAGILSMMGVRRQEATAARLEIEITLDSYDGATVPEGTLFGFETTFEDEVTEYVFQTVEPLVIASASVVVEGDPFPSGTVFGECITVGTIPNISSDVDLSILSPSNYILSAKSGAVFENGINEDTDSDYLARAVSFLDSLSASLNKASQVDSYISSNFSGVVGRVKTYDLTYGDTNLGDILTNKTDFPYARERTGGDSVTLYFSSEHQFVAGDAITVYGVQGLGESNFDGLWEVDSTTDLTLSYIAAGANSACASTASVSASVVSGLDNAGYVTIFVYGISDFVSSTDKETILDSVADKSVAGLTFDIRDFSLLPLEVEATIVLDKNFDQEPLQQVVTSAILEYLSPSSFPVEEDKVRKTQLVSLISKIPGVRYVDELTLLPSGTGWLPQIGDDLIFRYKGSVPNILEQDITITFQAA